MHLHLTSGYSARYGPSHTIGKALLIEAVQDRARRRYGSEAIRPAAPAGHL
ncbi:hypothetical protein GCM10010228_59040 [Streptomyces massasporeus]|nr:hypothetical protein GCM10010228_59040 [Streptomyces massasporeus]